MARQISLVLFIQISFKIFYKLFLCKTDDASTAKTGDDVSYSIRHVEESWHHLMKSEDTAKFKKIAVCNFDFLLASVRDCLKKTLIFILLF